MSRAAIDVLPVGGLILSVLGSVWLRQYALRVREERARR